MSLKKMLTAFTGAASALEWEAQLYVMHEEAAAEARNAERTMRSGQAEIVSTLMRATEDGTLQDTIRSLRYRTDETGVEALWDLVTSDIAGVHHDVDLSTASKRQQYLKVLEALLAVAQGDRT